MAGDVAISVQDVWKRFRRSRLRNRYSTLKSLLVRRRAEAAPAEWRQVLSGVSFEVPQGETWGIIGPNGAGKSTILKLLTGIYRPDRGTIRVRGRLASLIELGAGFHPDFTGRENVMLNGIILGMTQKEIAARFDKIVEFAELGEFIDEPVRTYSTGMYMRLGFSIAVHVDPDVLFLDEVLSVGDESFSRKCRARLTSFQTGGKTLLMVSHDLGAVASYCSHVLRIGHGQIVDRGRPEDVIRRYREEVAAGAASGVS